MIKDDFERRYSRKPNIYDSSYFKENLDNVSRAAIEPLKKNPNRPASIGYYDEILTSEKRIVELKNSKVIGSFCNFVPDELIYASGATPVRLCSGYYEPISVAEELLPRDICPLVKSSFSLKMLGLGYFDLCSLVILPTTCDAKKKLGEYISDYLPVWILDLPNRKDYEKVKYSWLKEIKILKTKLENFTGNKITRKKLKYWIQIFQKRSKLFRKIYQLRIVKPNVISHRDLLIVIQTSFYDDVNRWIEKTQDLYSELEERSKKISHFVGYKLLVTGAPLIWPNFKILNIIEDLGGVVVVDDLCSGTQRLWNYAEPDEWTMEGMLEAIASKYILPSICPCFTTTYDRIDKLLNMIQEFKIDGVIYHNLRLCQLFDMERELVCKVLKEKNVAVLTIHTDYSHEDTAQIKTRIEAFLEMLSSRLYEV